MPSAAMRRPVLLAPAVALTAFVAALLVPMSGVSRADEPTPASIIPTTLRLTAPGSVRAGSHATVWVRLVQVENGGETPVSGASVLVERQSARGWVQVVGLRTRSDGLAHGQVSVPWSARFRAVYKGDTLRKTSASRTVVIVARTTTTTLGQKAVAEAKRHRGAPYRYGAGGPNSFDCSGLTMYVFHRLGRSLPHNAAEQAQVTKRISDSAKKPGDLIFTYHGGSIGHVGIYAGGDQMWAAVKTGDVVRLQAFSAGDYSVGRVS
jgi:cell wall-associated NlpC family hydrolase